VFGQGDKSPSAAEQPVAEPETLEMDELFTFVAQKKASLHSNYR
jgi:hypothetical protein